MTQRSQTRSQLPTPRISCTYLDEPLLLFCGEREHISAKAGMALFGPRSLDMADRHPAVTRVGMVGSAESLESAYNWITNCQNGVDGEEQHDTFPGYTEHQGFYARLDMSPRWNQTITQAELRIVAKVHQHKARFLTAVELVSDKLRALTNQDSRPPEYVILALPDALLTHCETVDYTEHGQGIVHRDFRRAIKAEAMRYHLPTQILRQRTTEADDKSREIDHRSRVAWNFFSGLYFKSGGIPWSPKGLQPGTCYIGISFFRVGGSTSNALCSSVAQAFNEYGDGLVLRGQEFTWDAETYGPSPHLSSEHAKTLIEQVLKQYQDMVKRPPRRIVIHKSSRFWPAESEGFQDALDGGSYHYDLVAIRPQKRVRLLREGKYPPLRGTQFAVDDINYLYTTGYIPALDAYPHGHVPSPLQLADHIGDSSTKQILQEVLLLSKMNWNTTAFADLRPITLRFSQLVGDIMREIPVGRQPLPQFKYYT